MLPHRLPRALLSLILLQARAALRRLARGARTVKGALLAAVGLAMFVLWLLPTFIAVTQAPPVDPQQVRDLAPLALLGMTLAAVVSGGDRALLFTPGEVNFLFAGPFTRRQLLGYKLLKAALGSLFMALAMSVALSRFASFWPAAFAGALLALLFINLATTCAGLLRQTISAGLYTPLRHAILFTTLIALAAGIALAVGQGGRGLESVSTFTHSPIGRVLLAPFVPFTRAFTAEAIFPDLLVWASVGAAINLGLFALAMRLDANFLETAAAAGERAYEQAQKTRRGDWLPGINVLKTSRARVPAFPWLGGAGPVAWRQLATLLRRSPKLLFVLVLSVAVFAPVVFIGRTVSAVQGALVPALAWITVLLVGSLRFDFRGDLDQMAWLKALPLRPLPLAAGQLAVPAAALLLFHVAAFGAVAATIEPLRRPVLIALVLAPPADLLLVAIENGVFLLFPHRPAPPAELGALGRQILLLMLKLVTTLLAFGVAGGIAGAAFFFTRSLTIAVASAFVVLTVLALALVPCVALAYRRFDPASDTPP